MPSVTVEMKRPVTVRTFEGDSDEPVSEFTVDYGTRDGRSRIHRHITWAVNNSVTVEIESVT